MLHENLSVVNGILHFAGRNTVELCEKYKTPLMLLDEDTLRKNMRMYNSLMNEYFPKGSMVLYASKALSFKEIYRICNQENIGTDIVSPGELYTAKTAGFPMERAFFHGNNKLDSDIAFAMENGIGYFNVDTKDELYAIDKIAKTRGIKQKVLLRLTPGIDPHTHSAISTGKVDSKFGTAIETGQAFEIVKLALSLENIELCGFHCHIGSQIFEVAPFCDAADIMLDFTAKVRAELDYSPEFLNLGGGFGVRYVESHEQIDIPAIIKSIAQHLTNKCREHNIEMPKILFEPGRSMVASCGMTLYTVGSIKEITGFKNYVSIDGGMTDNPRYALYGSEYSVITANKASGPCDYVCTIAGRCCESGDLIQENVLIAKPQRGDYVAVLVTGAYNYSMASNYNKVCRPPIVMLSKAGDRVVVQRESFEHLTALDV